MDLEAELDKLYQASPSAFVGERNKLAKELRQARGRPAADGVARLQRPTPAAWAVNQTQFRAPELLRELRQAGVALRRAQESAADGDEFALAKRAHQDALRAAVDRATSISEQSGATSGAVFRRRLEMTLNLFSAAADDVTPPPGRMSAELEPLGFDALTEVAPAPPVRLPKRPQSPEEAAHAEKMANVKAALDAADKEVTRLEREAELAVARHSRAARDVEDAESRAEAARRSRDEARKDADEANERLGAARRALAEARRALEEK